MYVHASSSSLDYAIVCTMLRHVCTLAYHARAGEMYVHVCTTSSGFLPPTMSYVTYDVVRHAQTTSYVRRTTSCFTSHVTVRCCTCDIQDEDVRHRTCYIVRHILCRTSTYDIVRGTYYIVSVHLHISYTMSYVGNGYTMSYVHDIRYRIRHRMYVRWSHV
jgi:hypothetical protein